MSPALSAVISKRDIFVSIVLDNVATSAGSVKSAGSITTKYASAPAVGVQTNQESAKFRLLKILTSPKTFKI